MIINVSNKRNLSEQSLHDTWMAKPRPGWPDGKAAAACDRLCHVVQVDLHQVRSADGQGGLGGLNSFFYGLIFPPFSWFPWFFPHHFRLFHVFFHQACEQEAASSKKVSFTITKMMLATIMMMTRIIMTRIMMMTTMMMTECNILEGATHRGGGEQPQGGRCLESFPFLREVTHLRWEFSKNFLRLWAFFSVGDQSGSPTSILVVYTIQLGNLTRSRGPTFPASILLTLVCHQTLLGRNMKTRRKQKIL